MAQQVVTVDFETYYDSEYSVSKMPTRDYIMDDRFEVIGMAIKFGENPELWITDDTKIAIILATIDWSQTVVAGHNLMFDGGILAWRYGVKPYRWFDTLALARAEVKPFAGSAALAKVSEHFNLNVKGGMVQQVRGMRRADFSPLQLEAYGDYSKGDVGITHAAAKHLLARFNDRMEMRLVDRTIRMFLEPQLRLDANLLRARLKQIRDEHEAALAVTGLDRAEFMSNKKFAAHLAARGVDVPMKTSKATGKQTYAFAKTDEGLTLLLDDPDPVVRALVSTRLMTKGTIEEAYCQTLIDQAERYEALAVPLSAYGAHTGRLSGGAGQGFNPQNLKRGSVLRAAIKAAPGRKIVAADASQIEARCLAWLAGQNDVVEAFARDEDVYARAAEGIYGYPVNKDDNPNERFLGKVAVLSCGYQSGGGTFRAMARVLSRGRVNLTLEVAADIVKRWRKANAQITYYWRAIDDLCKSVFTESRPKEVGFGPFVIGAGHVYNKTTWCGYIQMPTGFRIYYPSPRLDYTFEKEDGSTVTTFGYLRANGKTAAPKSLYGGFLAENVTQGLCRVITMGHGVQIAEYPAAPWVMTVHDENVFHPREEHAERVAQACKLVMSAPPAYAQGLPLNCTVGIGNNYLEVK